MKPVTVFIVDDNFIARRGLRSALESEECITVAGESSAGAEAVRSLQELDVDVILMDIRMSDMDGIQTTLELLRVRPEAKVLRLTVVDDPVMLANSLIAGARGYLVYGHFTPDCLTGAVRTVASGGTVQVPPVSSLFPGVVNSVAREMREKGAAARQALTPRENEVLRLIAAGHENREIAAALHIEEKTVKNHINSIYSKLDIDNRQEAVLYVLDMELNRG